MIQAEIEGVGTLEFPDGTDPAVVQRTVKQYLTGPLIDPHTGKVQPSIKAAEPSGVFQRLRDYLGIREPKTTPLDIEAMERKVTPFQVREEVFGTGKVEEFRRVVGQAFGGATGGLTDLVKGYEEKPETWPGAVLGAGAELGGFLLGPLKLAQGVTGTRLAPTAKGLAGVAQVMAHGAANLGLASMISSIMPSLMKSNTLTEYTMEIAESGAVGGLTGLLFPAMGAIPTKPLRLAVSLAVMDKIRSGPHQWFTIDDVVKGVKDGTISAPELGKATFGYLMDTYFTLKVPSMKTQLQALDNLVAQKLATQSVNEVEQTILGLTKRGDIQEPAVEGITPEDITRRFGSDKVFDTVTSQVQTRAVQATIKQPWEMTKGEFESNVLYRGVSSTTRDAPNKYWTDDLSRVANFFAGSKGTIRIAKKSDVDPTQLGVGESNIQGTVDDVLRAHGEIEINPLIQSIPVIAEVPIGVNPHKFLVQQALSEGKPVPPNVLAEYPDLVKQAKSPPQSKPPVDQGAMDVERMYNHADTEIEAMRTPTLKDLRQKVAAATLDVSAEVKKQLLEQGGSAGKRAIMRHDLIRGMGARTAQETAQLEKEIWGDLSKAEEKLLDRIIQSRRTISIDEHRVSIEGEPVKHPEGLGGGSHQQYLDVVKANDPALFAKLNTQADRYFKAMDSVVDDYVTYGLLSQEAGQRLKAAGDYSPRRFLQHIDPDRTYTFEGRTISVPDSGLKRLDTGSEGLLENEARLLLRQVKARTNHRIARNQANQELMALAEEFPGNGVASVLPQDSEKAPSGMEIISVMIDGEVRRMVMPRSVAKQWVESDPAINSQMANLVGWLSGAKVLRAMATGMNPEFALTNMPRDVVHAWLTTHEFSPHLPVFLAQMAKDYAVTAKDAIHRTGAYADAIHEGLGMDFLTHQGRVGHPLTGVWADIQKVMGWAGETSEIWTRLAVRNRALTNGKPSYEATWTARNYLDFSQGGWAIKGIDTAVPYLSASIQATRTLARSAKEAPAELTWKIAQLMTVSTGLFLANRLINEDAWKAIPSREKVNNFIITTPFSYMDEEGNQRWLYFKIAKDQSQRVFATLAESLMGRTLGDPVDADQVSQAVQDFLPLMPTEVMPPALSAIMGYYANKDFWRNEDIWKGPDVRASEEFTPRTHPVLREIGQISGLSPERLKYALTQYFTYGNIFTSAVSGPTSLLMKALGEPQRAQTTQEMLQEIPGLRRLMNSTKPLEPYRAQIEEAKIEDQTAHFVAQRKLDALSDATYKAKKAGGDTKPPEEAVREYIKQQPPGWQEGFVLRHVYHGLVYNIPDRAFWLSLQGLSPEARANVYWLRWKTASKAEQSALQKRLASIPGLASDRFALQFEQLKTAAKGVQK